MSTMLKVEALTREAFQPFGDVIEADRAGDAYAINSGTSQRFHDLARLDPGEGGRLIVSIFRAQPRVMPFTISGLENHPLASQAFMPLSGHPFLVVVAPISVDIDPGQVRAFLASGRQGVNFNPGVWHHPLLALQGESDFLVIDRDRSEDNCTEQALAQPLIVNPSV